MTTKIVGKKGKSNLVKMWVVVSYDDPKRKTKDGKGSKTFGIETDRSLEDVIEGLIEKAETL